MNSFSTSYINKKFQIHTLYQNSLSHQDVLWFNTSSVTKNVLNHEIFGDYYYQNKKRYVCKEVRRTVLAHPEISLSRIVAGILGLLGSLPNM